MDLQYYGVDLSVEEFIDNYLPLGDAPHVNAQGEYVGCDPREAFPGSPYEESGWGCYSPVIEKALVRALEDSGRKDLAVARLDGSTLEDLYGRYVSQGVPVLLWATIGMEEPWVSQTFTIQGTGGGVRLGVPHALPAVGGGGGGTAGCSTTPWPGRPPPTGKTGWSGPTRAWAARRWPWCPTAEGHNAPPAE